MDDTTRAQLRTVVDGELADLADTAIEAGIRHWELTQYGDAIMAAFEAATAMRKITPETMPEANVEVAACDPGGWCWWIAQWETDRDGNPWWTERQEHMTIDPAYWAPLPTLPKDSA